ncbi:MAG: fused MFS/spermidine synthase [Alphaproteobacteria bacterium]
MKFSPLVLIYSLTLLLSAALLFSVQPMFSKMVLPYLGGTPQVWNTCMLFFQVMLLGGYAYAHGTTKYLGIKAQAILQFILLLVFTVVLPIVIPADAAPPEGNDPTLWQLGLMLMTVGGPFFVLAASAPMLQRWFAASGDKDADNPYFLYGASNLGSMTSLLIYPVIIEPLLTLTGQAHLWMLGYFVLIALTGVSALAVWKNTATAAPVRSFSASGGITWRQRFLWLALAFIPSSLMLGVTTFITMDIAAVPMLWILPLAIYVGTFILVFARKQLLDLKTAMAFQGIMLILLAAQKITLPFIDPLFLIGIHLSVFFFSAMTCHIQLAQSRPSARHLTEFYLIMSLGGAIGGFFNAIIAPQFMVIPLEYVFALVLACMARYALEPAKGFKISLDGVKAAIRQRGFDSIFSLPFLLAFLAVFISAFMFASSEKFVLFGGTTLLALILSYVMDRRWLFSALVAVVFLFFPLGYHWGGDAYNDVIHRDRNFFGIVKIANTKNGERILLHGTTNHGTQAQDEKFRLTPLSYYSINSPIRDVFKVLDKRPGDQKIGILGLGIGVTACFKKPGRSIEYFEIDKLVKNIAENPEYFTFLRDCGTPYSVTLGDGRLTMAKKPDDTYDLIVSDAFTSDNIPIHLITAEALQMYLEKIKDDGAILIHISNRFLDLEPVLHEASKAIGVPAIVGMSDETLVPGTEIKAYASHWVLFSRNEKTIKALRDMGWSDARPREGVQLWTDQYSNIFRVLNNVTGFERSKENEAKKKAAEAKSGAK